MTIKFYLDKPQSIVETSIYMFLRYGKSTLKFNTTKRILPKLWNTKTPENHFRKFLGSPEMNTSLNKLKFNINKLYYSQENWDATELKEQCNNLIKNISPKDSSKEFWEALEEFINTREKNNDLAKTTITKYRTLQAHLVSFSKDEKYAIRFTNINRKFYEDLSSYFRTTKLHSNNTVNKYLRTLKTFIHWAIDNQYTKSDIVSTKFRISDDVSEVIFLTMEELMKIVNLPLNAGSALDKARDVFCFGCFTGQRFSDIANIKRMDIDDSNWTLHQIKTKDTAQIKIPLNPYALRILDKYKDCLKPLPVISNQKTNEHLKLIGKEAGINSIVKKVKYRGNERIESSEPKYKHIGTHSARRSFITLSLEMGMRPETVMSISGHTDYKSMKRYIAVTDRMKENEMKIVWTDTLNPSLLKKVD